MFWCSHGICGSLLHFTAQFSTISIVYHISNAFSLTFTHSHSFIRVVTIEFCIICFHLVVALFHFFCLCIFGISLFIFTTLLRSPTHSVRIFVSHQFGFNFFSHSVYVRLCQNLGQNSPSPMSPFHNFSSILDYFFYYRYLYYSIIEYIQVCILRKIDAATFECIRVFSMLSKRRRLDWFDNTEREKKASVYSFLPVRQTISLCNDVQRKTIKNEEINWYIFHTLLHLLFFFSSFFALRNISSSHFLPHIMLKYIERWTNEDTYSSYITRKKRLFMYIHSVDCWFALILTCSFSFVVIICSVECACRDKFKSTQFNNK